MPTLEIEGFQFDDRNKPKLAVHGVTIRETYEVLWAEPKSFRNHSAGAPWILIGPTFSGRMITHPDRPDRGAEYLAATHGLRFEQ